MIFRGCAPGGARVVDQDVDVAHALQRFVDQPPDVFFLAAVRRDPARVDAGCLQAGRRFFEIGGFARRQHDLRAGLAERMRHLQSKPA